MGAIEHLTVRLSAAAAQKVRSRVAAGDFADASAMVEQALAALHGGGEDAPAEVEGPATEHWLRTDVAAIYDAMKRNPSRGVALADAVAQFRAERIARGE